MIALAQYESNQSTVPSTKAPSPSGAGREPTLKLCLPAKSTPRSALQRATSAEHALHVALDRLIDAAAEELRADLAAKHTSSNRPR